MKNPPVIGQNCGFRSFLIICYNTFTYKKQKYNCCIYLNLQTIQIAKLFTFIYNIISYHIMVCAIFCHCDLLFLALTALKR